VARVLIEHLCKTFADPGSQQIRAVADLCLTVAEKELLVLAGPSGCGKTTMLRLIAGLESPDRGSISIDGRDMTNLPPQDRDLALVFQSHALYPHMTARENMTFGLKVRKLSKAELECRIDEASSMLRIEDCLERLPADLSGGQRQRVALGRALVLKPKMLLLDEPLSNLDAPLRAQMRAELLRLHKDLQCTMIYVTHDHLEAMTLGQRIAVMRAGKLEQVAEPLTIYRQPANQFVAVFFGAPPMNLFKGRLAVEPDGVVFEEVRQEGEDKAFRISLRDIDAGGLGPFDGRVITMGLRPEDISVPAGRRSQTTIEADLELVESFGHEIWLHLATAGHEFIARTQAGDEIPKPGRAVVNFDLARVHFFDPVTGERIG
jgi:multiple sugar transport system ATP-binding protein